MFFGVISYLPSKFGVDKGRTYHIFAEKQGFIKYFDDGINPSANDIFHNYHNREKELFAVIEKQTGQKRQRISPSKTEQILVDWLTEKGITISSTPQPAIIYSFDNVQVTGANFQFLEFDIKASTSFGTADFRQGELLIEYNANVFGQNIVANAGVIINKETVILSPDYTLSVNDETPSKFRINVDATTTNTWFISMGTGIGAGEKDLYSTMVHELGHGHLLNHAWTTVKVMYPYGAIGVLKRTLTNAEIAGGKKVMSYSNTTISCLSLGATINIDSMEKYLCTTPIEPPIVTKPLEFYPNPATNRVEIHGIDDLVLSIQLIDYTGKEVLNIRPNSLINSLVLPENLAEGLYFITCTTKENNYVGKIQIQK